MNIPRPEYPRPQMVRPIWTNLNGEWEFDFDFSDSGRARGLPEAEHLEQTILVPFCPESRLSGIGFTDFMPAVWYKRRFTVAEADLSGRLLLHFGAVDYRCEVWLNGRSVGVHQGGYTPFTLDITDAAQPGENLITVCAQDDVRSGRQPRGKQSSELRSHGCDYTRTTGIWQTVWLEPVPKTYIAGCRVTPDYRNGKVSIDVTISGCPEGLMLTADADLDGRPAGRVSAKAAPHVTAELPLSLIDLWEPGHPALYDLTLSLSGGDRVTGYFGLRGVEVHDGAVYLNGKPVFQRLVLDQGFYPDGIYTAPTDDDLKADIIRCQDLGFNGARLHQKVFEPRFLYWADKLGYLCWGEYPNWGFDITRPEALAIFLPEWTESVERDFNHPSIVGWCPFNETQPEYYSPTAQETVLRVYEMTKLLDRTRPVIDTSGFVHTGKTDLYDVHDYEQDPAVMAEHYARTGEGECFENFPQWAKWDGRTPLFVSEYGGTWWSPGVQDGWGYGQASKTEEEVCSRYCGLTRVLLENEKICAFCYTQPYDVEQEQNGLFRYDRTPKFSPEIYRRIRETNQLPAAIETR